MATTLQDLLDLLPDNDSGAIDAADLREIVTVLWTDGAEVVARVQAIETRAEGGDTSVTARWQVNPQAGATPGGQQVTCDTGSFSSASWLRFTPIDQDNKDMTAALLNAEYLYGQQADNAEHWCRWLVSSPAVDHDSYIEVGVEEQDHAGSVGSAGWQSAMFVIRVPRQ